MKRTKRFQYNSCLSPYFAVCFTSNNSYFLRPQT